MNTNFVRKVDYFIGIPLSFILSITKDIKKTIFKNLRKKTPKKILLMEISEMGSIILSYPAIKKLKEIYPDAELFFLTFKKNIDAIKILNIIKEKNILTLDDNSIKKFSLDVIKNIIKLRKEKIDTVLDLELFARFSNLISYVSGAKNRIGFDTFKNEGLYRGNLLTHRVYYNQYKHISINFMALVESLKENPKEIPLIKKELKIEDSLPEIKISEKDKENIFNKLRNLNKGITKKSKIIIFNHEAGDIPIREWPLNNFVSLGKMLLEKEDIFIVLIGTSKAKKSSLKIEKNLNNSRCLNLTGKTNFKELIDLFSISNLMIGIDNGPSHFASLTRTKTIVLFGPETPTLYKPLNKNSIVIYKNLHCSPCLTAFNHRTTPCKDNKCLKNINPIEVYKEAIKLINNEYKKFKKR